MDDRKIIRCAVYTRKSTEEGLEQEFNSLDAQREAGSAYILSQRHEGWIEVAERYDDGGYSGGNMERPGLKRLLADIASGKVDTIVVYKVDRLTRALTDFARIVEVLDARGASFVSVTQSLNSTTSMGRLTLNVLLSFAQFEREVTGERIRDKIAASKRKGMFMGGLAPIGYDVQNRKLVINEAEAAAVRHIFARYAELGSVRDVVEELRAGGYRTRLRKAANRTIGGIPFESGTVCHLLSSQVYIGKVAHKGEVHEGEHQPIIDDDLWARVQQRTADNRVGNRRTRNSHCTSLLAGVLRDGHGRRMTPSHAVKNGKRYRYYVTHAAELRPGAPEAWRMPAADVESAVVTRLIAYFRDYREIATLAGIGASAADIRALVERAGEAAERLLDQAKMRSVISKLVTLIALTSDELKITIDRGGLARTLDLLMPQDDTLLVLTVVASKVREGKATKLVLAGAASTSLARDPKLVALLAEARATRDLVLASPDRTIRDIANEQQRCRHRIARMIRLSWLSPDIATTIVEGRQPRSLTPRKLLDTDWPLEWNAQAAVIGP
jgi:site-specific DNA recombinase